MLTLEPGIVEITGDASGTQPSDATIANISAVSQEITWVRTVNDIPEDWTTAVCDIEVCYAPALSEALTPFTLDGGQSGVVHVNFYPNDVSGYGYVEMIYYSVTDSANYNTSGVFTADLSGVGFYSPSANNTFHIYPNPAVNHINAIASDNSKVKRLQIVNIVGKSVQTNAWESNSGNMLVDINSLNDGVYFVQFIDGMNNVVATKKISVNK